MEEIKELLETKQYTRLRQKLIELYDADIAQVLEEIPEEDMIKVFRILPKDKAADVFAYLEVEHQQMIITSLSERDAANIVNNMMADDAADLFEEMPANVVRRILASASADTRRDINHLLRYPDSSAGSIMTVEFVDLKENLTVAQALERVRKVGRDSETINNLYVLDKSRTLLGILTLRGLLLADPDKTVGEIMETNVVSVNTLMDQEDVAKQFKKYDFTAMPVVDNENRLVGIITVDDIVDIMEEETTEDIEKMAAIVPSDKPYMKTSVFETWKKRIPWLLLLMVSATFTGSIMKNFEEALGAIPALSFFIPMLMDTGGNAGGQASVTVIRGLSLEEIAFKDFFKVCWKEMRVAFLCGVTLAACNFLKLLFFDKVGVMIAFVVCITLIVAIFVAKLVGCSLPMVAKRLGFDPAVMASPFITTIVDALSLIVYFAVATNILGI
ncbi:MAG: magnesium transporter [Lachnospiraceae bacterium]|nr:magnesium transporter [Lachnospiraceae bacterium]MBQ3891456.1 magnesium transporter [Lachnospiraceae bacterium]